MLRVGYVLSLSPVLSLFLLLLFVLYKTWYILLTRSQNGGHCQPLTYSVPAHIAAFELANYDFLRSFAAAHSIPCDWTDLPVGGVHAYLTPELFAVASAAASERRAARPDLADNIKIVPGTDRARLAELHVPHAEGAIVQRRAASLWPYKLVSWLVGDLLSRFSQYSEFNLQTNTPVTTISQSLPEEGGGDERRWKVHTPQGNIVARQVLLATNGYTSALLPDMADLLVPVRGQVAALIPPPLSLPPSLASNNTEMKRTQQRLRASYLFAAQEGKGRPWRDEYMIQRPGFSSVVHNFEYETREEGGELILGGGRAHARGLGVGEWRDDEVEEGVARFLKGNLVPDPLDLSGSGSGSGGGGDDTRIQKVELEASHQWTGIMGYSRDACPWVGEVVPSLLPGRGIEKGGKGLFVCAGYTGHGMPNAALSARAVVAMMTNSADCKVPGEYVISEERIARVRRDTETVGQSQMGDHWAGDFPGLKPWMGQ